MKILQIGGTFVGAQKKIEESIHGELLERDSDSYILYAIGHSDDEKIIRYENRLDCLIRRGLRKVFGKYPFFARISTLKLIRYIKKICPDLIHIHVIHHGYLDYEYLLKRLAKQNIPIVFTAHDMWFFTGGCYYYSTVGCDGFTKKCEKCPKSTFELDCKKCDTAKYLRKKLELFRNLKKICVVSVSPWVYSEMKKSELASYPQYMIMNSVDKVNDCLPKCEKNEKFTVIGVAANWDERKGLKRFYELGLALEDFCDIILVGNVEESLKEKAPSNIIFYGYTSSVEELYNLYASSDLHVSMSFEETFGLTFIEAAMSGIKSMGYKSTAIPAVLEKVYGYIIPSCTVEESATKIRQLAGNRRECAITEQEYAEIKEYFSPERMAAEYLKVYEEMSDLSR